jgi:hypothetical protein
MGKLKNEGFNGQKVTGKEKEKYAVASTADRVKTERVREEYEGI